MEFWIKIYPINFAKTSNQKWFKSKNYRKCKKIRLLHREIIIWKFSYCTILRKIRQIFWIFYKLSIFQFKKRIVNRWKQIFLRICHLVLFWMLLISINEKKRFLKTNNLSHFGHDWRIYEIQWYKKIKFITIQKHTGRNL